MSDGPAVIVRVDLAEERGKANRAEDATRSGFGFAVRR